MSKYATLWAFIEKSGEESLELSFDEVGKILGFPIDHSFLNFKKELAEYGYTVEKISMKEHCIKFARCENEGEKR